MTPPLAPTEVKAVHQNEKETFMNIDRLKEMASEIRAAYPQHVRVQMKCMEDGSADIDFHAVRSAEEATQIMRSLGIGERHKLVFPANENCHEFWIMKGHEDGISVTCFMDGIPPTCRKEIYTEKIPKQETIDTGEFVEVQRVKIVCCQPLSPVS